MSGGTQEVHRDSDPLFTGTHDGADGSYVLRSVGAMFKSLGVIPGLAIENETQSQIGTVISATDDTVTTSEAELPIQIPFVLGEAEVIWNNGDIFNIYKTATKDSVISTNWVDVSKGWHAEKEELVNGWFADDVDLDDHGKYDVFGPGQPE